MALLLADLLCHAPRITKLSIANAKLGPGTADSIFAAMLCNSSAGAGSVSINASGNLLGMCHSDIVAAVRA